MSRPLRMEYAGAFYHVTSRGDQRGAVFLSDRDRMGFLEILAGVVERFDWRLRAWCEMTNHYHLLVETPHPNLCCGMRQLNGQYAARFNRLKGAELNGAQRSSGVTGAPVSELAFCPSTMLGRVH